jgi:hypothetical protein
LPDLWTIKRGATGAFAQCSALKLEGVSHAFGLRHHDAIGYGRERRLSQVHGARIVRGCEVGAQGVEADGAWDRVERLRGEYLAVRTADCVPILLAARDGSFIAAVHAGWRGTAQRIAQRAVRVLEEQGCPPETLVAVAGPSIGPCCYPVALEVATAVATASGVSVEAIARCEPGKVRLDLSAANREQLLDAGIPEESIHRAPWCTACETELFFSYRREGAAAGRQLSLIGPPIGRP